jgi:hypothetical protein
LRRDRQKSFLAGMTKTENRAAAKAYDRERMQKLHEVWRTQAVVADLEHLDKLRRYLIFHTKAREPARELIDAIDDYGEKADRRPADPAQSKPQHRMTIDRCDFQVPPAMPGWYGINSETGSKAALWNGADWAEYRE